MAPTCLLQPQINCVIYRAIKSTWSLQEAKRPSPQFHGPAQAASNSHIQGPASPTPPPCPVPSHTERNFSSLSFSLLTNLLASCYFSLRWWKGQAPALSHVHRGLAWHTATLVTGEVALLAGAQNCFLCEYFWPLVLIWGSFAACWMQHMTTCFETECPV